MQRRTQTWVGFVPLLACLLAAGTSMPAVRHQGTSHQRHRIQRPTRTSGVRLDGDHHHEETPHYLLPLGKKTAPPGGAMAISATGLPELPVLEGADELVRFFVAPPQDRFRSFPPGRAPPSSLL